jgi:hypothetical protein
MDTAIARLSRRVLFRGEAAPFEWQSQVRLACNSNKIGVTIVAVNIFSGLVSSACAFATAVAIAPMVALELCIVSLKSSKLIAPDFERLARNPCPVASLASSGISFLRSDFAASCSS